MIKGALILIYNKNGDLALQLRAKDDADYALHWDFSAGGGVDEGEDAEAAAKRELQEELGISASITEIGRITYREVKAFDPMYGYDGAVDDDESVVFRADYDGEFSPDPKEVQEIRFVSQPKLREVIAGGEKFHPELKYFLTKTPS